MAYGGIWAKRRADKIVDEYIKGQEHAEVVDGKQNNEDGYVNLINRYGTSMDNSGSYDYVPEPRQDWMTLEAVYEGNGLFSKIIDVPAQEAVKHSFELENLDEDIAKAVKKKLDKIGFEDEVEVAIRWARLFGGSVIVMLIDDGRRIDEPVDWRRVKGIEEVHAFEAPLISWNNSELYKSDRALFGIPETFEISSICGTFKVHSSRCLVFKNGRLPEKATDMYMRFWGVPEYTRIKEFLQQAVTSQGFSVKMMERSVQAVYSVKDLAELLQTEAGEDGLLKRLQAIDLCRSVLNTIAIDAEGEQFDFRQATFTGVQEVVDGAFNLLSAVTNIPQTVLFGKSPSGMNSTGESDLENYYNFIEQIQNKMLKKNYQKVMDLVLYGFLHKGQLKDMPEYELTFNPLWSLDEQSQVAVDMQKAQIEQIKAQTSQAYIDMQVLDPAEVRAGLAASDTYDVETLLDSVPADKLFDFYDRLEEQQQQQQMMGGMPGMSPEGPEGGADAPEASMPNPMQGAEIEAPEVQEKVKTAEEDAEEETEGYSEAAKNAARLYLSKYAKENPESYEEHKKDLARSILKNFAENNPEEYEERKKTLAREYLVQFAKENPDAHKKRKEELAEELLKSIDYSENSGIMNTDQDQSVVYGLCKGEGIDTKGMEPSEAWDALTNKTGHSAAFYYSKLQVKAKMNAPKNAGSNNEMELGTVEDYRKAKSAGKIKIEMNQEKQNAHVVGTAKYIERAKGNTNVSRITMGIDTLDKIIQEKTGNEGNVFYRYKDKRGAVKEIIDCGKIVGIDVRPSGKSAKTTMITVHHSKDGYHAVPAKPRDNK